MVGSPRKSAKLRGTDMPSTTFEPIRRALGVLLAAVLALAGLTLTAAPAHAATGGTIAVTVTLPDGGTPTHAGGGCASADLLGSRVADDCDPVAGTYELAVPEDGAYKVTLWSFPAPRTW